METLLRENIAIYYLLIFICLGIPILLNLPKNKRILQTKIASYYLFAIVILFIMVIFEAVLKSAMTNISIGNNMDISVAIFIMIIKSLSEFLTKVISNHYIIILLLIGIGVIQKIGLKLKPNSNIKKNFLLNKFFDSNNLITESGKVFSKVCQNISYTLAVLYLVIPICWHFELNVFYSSFITLFLMVGFLETYFSLNGVKLEIVQEEKNKKSTKDNQLILRSKLRERLKYSVSEDFENGNKMVLNKEEDLYGTCNLICEIANFEQFREINMSVMNSAFFENKKVLVICASINNAKEYYKNLSTFNKEYDGKITVKLLTENDKLFDNSLDMYVSTLENCFGNIKLLSKIDTIIIEDIDVIMQNKLELLRAFGSIVKMGNSNIRYVVLTYMLQGIESAVKNLLLIENITWYNIENKQQASKITLNVWDKKNVEIGDTILGKVNRNIGNLIPLALLGTKDENDRTLIISSKEPIDFQLNELNAIKNLPEKKFMNDEIEVINNKLFLSRREKYFEYKNNNYIVAEDDGFNVYDTVYKLSLINGKNNHINILSNQYLLRDYMVDTYEENKSRLKQFLPYIPHEVDNPKVILHSLLLQLTNFGVSENVLIRILNQNDIKVVLASKNNMRNISDALDQYIEREFGVTINTYSYIVLKQQDNKYVFDATKGSFVESELIYTLDKDILKLLPNELFKEISFSKDGFVLDIGREYTYNFYQKYLPGQKHSINGSIYEIKDIVESSDEINAIVETSTDYRNNMYRQVRKINMLGELKVIEQKKYTYSNVMVNYSLGKIDYEVETNGYYEFNNGILLQPNEYRYVEIDDKYKAKVKRNYKGANVLKIEFSKLINSVPEVISIFDIDNKEKVAQAFAFILSEILVSMIGSNSEYIQVKAVVSNNFDENKCNWVYPIKLAEISNENIEIYVFEDVELERGLIDMIYKNLDNIMEIMHAYLDWVINKDILLEDVKTRHFTYLRNIDSIDHLNAFYFLDKLLVQILF